jgi:hypothetical protein
MKSCFCLFGSVCKAPIRSPMHPRRLAGEGIERALTAAERFSDFLRLAQASVYRAFLLARVGQAVAAPAGE